MRPCAADIAAPCARAHARHGESYYPGQSLELLVRDATEEDLASHNHKRRQLGVRAQPKHVPMWHSAARSFMRPQPLVMVKHVATLDDVTDGEPWRRGRALEHTGIPRNVMTICIQYPDAFLKGSTNCRDSGNTMYDERVDQVGVVASYGRLDPTWDEATSRYFTVDLPAINESRWYFPNIMANYTDASEHCASGAGFCLKTMVCDDFMMYEPDMALAKAIELYPEASSMFFMHTEYLIPEDVNCTWGGLGSLGSYNPGTNGLTPIPGGTTWVRGTGKKVRAHEFGHNFGMLHSSNYNQHMSSRKYQAATEKPGGWCPETDAFSEYGDETCVMGGGAATFNAPQRLIEGWITREAQFASANIYPAGSLTSPPSSDHAICIFSEAELSSPAAHVKKFTVRKLSLDPQDTSNPGQCNIVYCAKEGHEGAATGDWLGKQVQGGAQPAMELSTLAPAPPMLTSRARALLSCRHRQPRLDQPAHHLVRRL